MARRRYSRAAKALTQLSKAKSGHRASILGIQNERQGVAQDIQRMNKGYALAGQALVTADKLVQGYKTRAKIEKGVTSLAEQKGGEISYSKTRLRDVFRGEGKLKDLGKESWEIGGTKYDRADVLAWESKTRKDLKWEGIVGKDLDGDKNVAKMEKKEYTISGDVMKKDDYGVDTKESKFGEGWSYKKQKQITKLQDEKNYAKRQAEWRENANKVDLNTNTKNASTLNNQLIKEGQEVQDADGNVGDANVKAITEANKTKITKYKMDADKEGTKQSDELVGATQSAKSRREVLGEREGIDFIENWKDRIKEKRQAKSDLKAANQSLIDERMEGRKSDVSAFGEDDYLSSIDKQNLERLNKSHPLSVEVPDVEGAVSMDSDSDFTDTKGESLAEYNQSIQTRDPLTGEHIVHQGSGSYNPEPPTKEFRYTADENIELLNAYIKKNMPDNSSLRETWDFNKAQAGEYDSEASVDSFSYKSSGENKGFYTNYDDEGNVIRSKDPREVGTYNYPVSLKGLQMKDMWSALGIGDKWDNRASMYKDLQKEGYLK